MTDTNTEIEFIGGHVVVASQVMPDGSTELSDLKQSIRRVILVKMSDRPQYAVAEHYILDGEPQPHWSGGKYFDDFFAAVAAYQLLVCLPQHHV